MSWFSWQLLDVRQFFPYVCRNTQLKLSGVKAYSFTWSKSGSKRKTFVSAFSWCERVLICTIKNNKLNLKHFNVQLWYASTPEIAVILFQWMLIFNRSIGINTQEHWLILWIMDSASWDSQMKLTLCSILISLEVYLMVSQL